MNKESVLQEIKQVMAIVIGDATIKDFKLTLSSKTGKIEGIEIETGRGRAVITPIEPEAE